MAKQTSATLKKENVVALSKLGITNVKTEEEARKVLLQKLAENEIEGLDDESLSDLMQMYESFAETSNDEEETEEGEEETDEVEEEEENDDMPDTEDEEIEELAEEVKVDAKKKAATEKAKIFVGKKKKVEVVEEEEEEIEEVEEEEEIPAPKNKVVGATVKKDDKKKAKPEVKAKTGRIKFESANEDQHGCLEQFQDRFPSEKYEISLLKNGISIKQVLKSKKKVIISYDKLILDDENNIIAGVLFFDCLKGNEEVDKYIDLNLISDKKRRNYTANLVTVSPISAEEFHAIINDELIELIDDRMNTFDNKLQKNRAKLEDKMNDSKAKKPVVSSKKQVAPAPVPTGLNKTMGKKKLVLKK